MSDRAAHSREWADGHVVNDGVRLHYYRTGRERPAIVLVHGFSDNGLCWRSVARSLEPSYDVIMVDARNHGLSATAPAGLVEQASDLAALIETLRLERPIVLGHSVGAATAAELAARRPELVSQLLLEDPPWKQAVESSPDALERRRREVHSYVEQLARMTDAEVHELGRRQHPDWPDHEYADWVAAKRQLRPEAFRSLGRARWEDVVSDVQCPTLVIHGEVERGSMMTPELAAHLSAVNARIVHEQVVGAGHNIRRENFGRFIEVISSFLER